MKKVRVLKELPGQKIGVELLIDEDSGITLKGQNYWIPIEEDEVLQMIEDGWLEYVEEERTLQKKISETPFERCENHEGLLYIDYPSCAAFSNVAREHFLGVVNKVFEEDGGVFSNSSIANSIRNAIKEAK